MISWYRRRTRTHDQEIKSLLLYQLSYTRLPSKMLKVSVFELWSRRMLYLLMIITILISPILKGGNNHPTVPISTFSIVARDQITGEIGVAVQSKFIAVGSVVPFAKAGVGAIASQAWGNVRFGPVGLDLLLRGKSSQEVVHID